MVIVAMRNQVEKTTIAIFGLTLAPIYSMVKLKIMSLKAKDSSLIWKICLSRKVGLKMESLMDWVDRFSRTKLFSWAFLEKVYCMERGPRHLKISIGKETG
jgi:hypothetical protein